MMAYHDRALNVEAARAVIAAPQMHTDAGLRQSIEVLKTCGDWMDHERARMLEYQLDTEALRPSPREAVWTVLGCVLLFVLLWAGFWIAAGMGWQ